jgi:hypothetical protein
MRFRLYRNKHRTWFGVVSHSLAIKFPRSLSLFVVVVCMKHETKKSAHKTNFPDENETPATFALCVSDANGILMSEI